MAGCWEQMAADGRLWLSARPQRPPAWCHLPLPWGGGRALWALGLPVPAGGRQRAPRWLQASYALGLNALCSKEELGLQGVGVRGPRWRRPPSMGLNSRGVDP